MAAGVAALICSISARADMDGRIAGMEAFLTSEPDHLKGPTTQLAECAAFEDASAGAAAMRPGDFEPGVGRAGQARVLCWHGADSAVSDFAELLAAR
jgi:beta-phosphoglucomutase-like phosphatase (HAD superfamily)